MFRLVYIDNDKKTFSVSNLMDDDTKIAETTHLYQQIGRQVTIHSIGESEKIEYVKNRYKQLGYEYDESTQW